MSVYTLTDQYITFSVASFDRSCYRIFPIRHFPIFNVSLDFLIRFPKSHFFFCAPCSFKTQAKLVTISYPFRSKQFLHLVFPISHLMTLILIKRCQQIIGRSNILRLLSFEFILIPFSRFYFQGSL